MVIQEWRKRFEEEEATQHRWDRDIPAADFPSPELGLEQYELHIGLKKAESSILTQARTGKIGLRAFLFGINVPTATTPICPYGIREESLERRQSATLLQNTYNWTKAGSAYHNNTGRREMSARHSPTRNTHTALYDGYYGSGDYRSIGLRWKSKGIIMSAAGTVGANRPAIRGRRSAERRGRDGEDWASS